MGGYSDTSIYTNVHRPGPFFVVQILNFNIFGGFQKDEHFLGGGGSTGLGMMSCGYL